MRRSTVLSLPFPFGKASMDKGSRKVQVRAGILGLKKNLFLPLKKYIHRYLKNLDCSSFAMCLLQVPYLPRHFWLFFAAATKSTNETNKACSMCHNSVYLSQMSMFSFCILKGFCCHFFKFSLLRNQNSNFCSNHNIKINVLPQLVAYTTLFKLSKGQCYKTFYGHNL